MSMAVSQQIRDHMEVVCADNAHLGTVDHVEGDRVKLTKADSPDGRHHYIPTSLVDHVDDKVHLSRQKDEVMRMWSSE